VGIVRWLVVTVALACSPPALAAEEPDHTIHEALRTVLRDAVAAIDAGRYADLLPLLTENVEVTSVTQEVMSGRADVTRYFDEWFGPKGYMKSMTMKMDADKLTDLGPDKRWGLVRGQGARALRGQRTATSSTSTRAGPP
jgi:hypothetical protein